MKACKSIFGLILGGLDSCELEAWEEPVETSGEHGVPGSDFFRPNPNTLYNSLVNAHNSGDSLTELELSVA